MMGSGMPMHNFDDLVPSVMFMAFGSTILYRYHGVQASVSLVIPHFASFKLY